MTPITFSNLYAEEFSLHNIAISPTWQLLGIEMRKASWGGLSFWRPRGGENWGGNPSFHPQAGEGPTALDIMVIYRLAFCGILEIVLWNSQSLRYQFEIFRIFDANIDNSAKFHELWMLRSCISKRRVFQDFFL